MVQEVQVRVRVVEVLKDLFHSHSTVGYLTTPSHKIGTKDASGSLKFFYDSSTVGSRPIRDVVRWSRLESTYIMIPWLLIFSFPLVPVATRVFASCSSTNETTWKIKNAPIRGLRHGEPRLQNPYALSTGSAGFSHLSFTDKSTLMAASAGFTTPEESQRYMRCNFNYS
jgi:hypothetical protein